jgi:sec-independent protein translocase protein TatA
MLGQLRGWEWLIIVALVLLLFGAKRLPDAARGLGRSLRIFKAETKGLTGDSGDDTATGTGTPAVTDAPRESLPPATPTPPASASTPPPVSAPAEPSERSEG